FNVGEGEVPALEQERLPASNGRRVSTAVTEVQRSRVPALAKAQERRLGEAQLMWVKRNRLNCKRGEQSLQLASADRSVAPLGHHQGLQTTHRRHQANGVIHNGARHALGFGLVPGNGQNRRSVDHLAAGPELSRQHGARSQGQACEIRNGAPLPGSDSGEGARSKWREAAAGYGENEAPRRLSPRPTPHLGTPFSS